MERMKKDGRTKRKNFMSVCVAETALFVLKEIGFFYGPPPPPL